MNERSEKREDEWSGCAIYRSSKERQRCNGDKLKEKGREREREGRRKSQAGRKARAQMKCF
jgi:hypothetical protein